MIDLNKREKVMAGTILVLLSCWLSTCALQETPEQTQEKIRLTKIAEAKQQKAEANHEKYFKEQDAEFDKLCNQFFDKVREGKLSKEQIEQTNKELTWTDTYTNTTWICGQSSLAIAKLGK